MTAQHIQAVGTPRGKISPNNLEGYSTQQKRQMNLLLKYDESTNLINQSNNLSIIDYRSNLSKQL